MTSLDLIQELFSKALSSGDSAEAKAQLAQYIEASHGLAVNRRIDVYRSTTREALVNALSKTFPVCLKVLGDTNFFLHARSFADLNPAKSSTLNDYGEDFPEFLLREDTVKPLPFLKDLGRVEWLITEAYFSAPSAPFDPQKFTQSANEYPDNVYLNLGGDVRLFESLYPIDKILEVVLHSDSFKVADYTEEKVRLIIHRPSAPSPIERVSEEEFFVLNLMKKGISFQKLAEECASRKIQLDSILPSLIGRQCVFSSYSPLCPLW